jgi:uncharacterized membrane protein
MDWLNPFSIVLGSTGFVFWAMALYLGARPPKKINHIYGYRTKRSMASQDAWDFAQIYSANLMYRSGLILLALSLVRVYISGFMEVLEVIVSMFIVIGSCLYLIVDTENALKSKFGK